MKDRARTRTLGGGGLSATHRRGWIALLAAVVASACSSPAPSGPPTVADLPTFEAVEEMRIGALEDADQGFSRIGGVDVDRDGRLFVVEAGVPEIRVFTAEGEFSHRFGGRGQGPAEFESSPQIGVKGDTVWAVQSFRNRIQLFDRSGTLISTASIDRIPVPLPQGIGFVVPRRMRADGRWVGFFGMVSSSRGEATGVEPTDSIPWPMTLFNSDGSVGDTLGWISKPPPTMWRPPSQEPPIPEYLELGGRRHAVPQARPQMERWYPTDDGYIAVDAPRPTSGEAGAIFVHRILAGGDTVFSQAVNYSPVPFTDADLDSIAARAARGGPGGFGPYRPGASVPDDWEVIAARLRAEMAFPPWQDGLTQTWPANDDRLWLRLANDRQTGRTDWVILDANGFPAGRLSLPETAQPRWASGDVLWAAEPDQLEVPWLVRYRISGLTP